jgi:hypothetical protein
MTKRELLSNLRRVNERILAEPFIPHPVRELCAMTLALLELLTADIEKLKGERDGKS